MEIDEETARLADEAEERLGRNSSLYANGDEPGVETKDRSEPLSEDEVKNVLTLLDSSELGVNRVFTMSKGSKSAEESSGVLKTMFQKMTDQSNTMLVELEKGRDLGELGASESAYEKDMGESYTNSMQALEKLRERVQILPEQMASGLVFDLQQIENNLKAINSIVNRNH